MTTATGRPDLKHRASRPEPARRPGTTPTPDADRLPIPVNRSGDRERSGGRREPTNLGSLAAHARLIGGRCQLGGNAVEPAGIVTTR